MKLMHFSSIVLFVLACCSAFGQTDYTQGTRALPTGMVGGIPTTQPDTASNAGCGEEASPAFRPPQDVLGRCVAIREYMRYTSPISPIGDMVVSMMGDETAFFLQSIILSRPPLTAVQALTVLDLIHNSFKQPVFIRSQADRKPEKSLALLKMLQATAVEQAVKERIAAETTFLTTLPATVTPIPILNLPPKPGVLPVQADFTKP